MPTINARLTRIQVKRNGQWIDLFNAQEENDMATIIRSEHPAIARARQLNTEKEHDRAFVLALLNDPDVFELLVEGHDDTDGLREAIDEVLSGAGLIDSELREALSDYDKIKGNDKGKIAAQIDRLQAELNTLRVLVTS